MSFVNCHVVDAAEEGCLVVELDEVEVADVDVDRGFMLIEFRLMNDEVRVVDRVKVVFVADFSELDAVVLDVFVDS